MTQRVRACCSRTADVVLEAAVRDKLYKSDRSNVLVHVRACVCVCVCVCVYMLTSSAMLLKVPAIELACCRNRNSNL
jgi:hypothetical protein